MDEATRGALIEQYAAGFDAVVAALEGASQAEMEAREGPAEWSPRQIVHHLADSEMTSAIRLRRLLVEDRPLIQGYDQAAFAECLYYDRPTEASLLAFRYARESTTPILRRMPETQWLRAGEHSEVGRFSAEDWLAVYGRHAHDHADQIRRARNAHALLAATSSAG